MHCESCGEENPRGSAVCHACGAPLGAGGRRMDVTPEVVSALDVQSAWQTSGAPSPSYESLGEADEAPAVASARQGSGPLVAVVAVLLAVLLVGVGFAFGSGLFAGGDTTEQEAGPKIRTSEVRLSFSLPGIDPASSRIPILISGTTSSGEEFSHTYYISSMTGASSEPIELEDGTYNFIAVGSPISSTGIVYDFDAARDTVTLDAAHGQEPDAADLAFEPIPAAEVTDEEIEAAYRLAAADPACTNADALREAAYSRRAQALQ